MDWRPPDWDSEQIVLDTMNSRDQRPIYHDMVEAGADAMLGALRAETEGQEWSIEVNGVMGHYLFIPNEEEATNRRR